MSSTVSFPPTSALQAGTVAPGAPLLRVPLSSAPASVGGAGAGDVVQISKQAQNYLQGLDVLSSFEERATSGPRGGNLSLGFSGPNGSAAVSMQAGGPGASVDIGEYSFRGHNTIRADVQGSATGNDVINLSLYSNGASNDSAIGVIRLGNGNDTVSTATNGYVQIDPGNGNDNISTTSTGAIGGFAYTCVHLGSGNDTVNVNGGGFAGCGTGSGNDVINLTYNPAADIVGAAMGGSGSGTTIINGDGNFCYGWAGNGTGTTIINNVSWTMLGGISTGPAIVNPGNSSYNQVEINPGFGDSVINLSDPAAGVTGSVQTYQMYADGNTPPIQADANGNYSGSIYNYTDVVPTEGQAGYGQAHTLLDFRDIPADQVTSQLQGSTLTLTVATTGETLTINNYQPGRLTFSFAEGDNLTASRTPPGLATGS